MDVSGVKFSHVETKEFERGIGVESVPSEGGWPLGIRGEGTIVSRLSVDAFEGTKQERLQARLDGLLKKEKSKKKKKILKTLSKRIGNDDGDQSKNALETRPWDYTEERDNPLFGKLEEESRQEILRLVLASELPPPDPPRRSSRRGLSQQGGSDTTTKTSEIDLVETELKSLRESRLTYGCTCHRSGDKCTRESCPCVQSGIRCDYMACSCCDFAEPCGNPHGMCLYEADVVDQHRRKIIQSQQDSTTINPAEEADMA